MTRYRFLDGMGDVIDERDFADHAAALTWARDDVEKEDEVQRVEFLGPEATGAGPVRWWADRPRKRAAASTDRRVAPQEVPLTGRTT